MATMRQIGDAFCEAFDRADWEAMQKCVNAWRNIKEPQKKTDKNKDILSASKLGTKYFIDKMSQLYPKMLCTPASVEPHIKKLLKHVDLGDILKAIDWLVTVNPHADYPLVVLSGRALYEKWDKIQYHMEVVKPKQRREFF